MLINHSDVVDEDEDENDIEYIRADLWKHWRLPALFLCWKSLEVGYRQSANICNKEKQMRFVVKFWFVTIWNPLKPFKRVESGTTTIIIMISLWSSDNGDDDHGDDHVDDHGDDHGDDHDDHGDYGDDNGDDHGGDHGDDHGDGHNDDHGEYHGDDHGGHGSPVGKTWERSNDGSGQLFVSDGR